MLLLLCLLLVANPTQLSKAQIGTQVGGILWDNTTWFAADSPYIITSTIQIPFNVTLTILPGVIITCNNEVNFMFLINGNITALGTPTDKIVFSGNQQSSFISNTGSNDSTFVNLEYCSFTGYKNWNYFWYGYGLAYLNLTHSELTNIGLSTISGSANIAFNSFINTGYFCVYSLENSIDYFQNNLFYNSGIKFQMTYHYTPIFEVHNNSFINTNGYALELSHSQYDIWIVNATQNYWGATNTAIISSLIHDKNNDITIYGVIPYEPFLTAPDPDTPTCVHASAGLGGNISPSDYIPLRYGSNQSFTILANIGYHLVNLSINGTAVNSTSSYTIRNITDVTTITAKFALNPPGDFNQDGRVDGNDFLYFLGNYVSYWTNNNPDSSCDLNHDCKIDSNDFFLFMNDYIAYWQSVS